MSRPRKSTKLLELSGSLRHNPGRHASRLFEPKPLRPLGEPPDRMSDEEKAAWHELAGLAAPGVLMCSDRWLVELCCATMVKIRKRGCDSVSRTELSLLVQGLGKMGLTPGDRSRVSPSPQDDGKPNPFSEMASAKRPN